MLTGLISALILFGRISNTSSFPQPLPPDEEAKCLKGSASGDLDARNKLIVHNQRLVAFIAKRFKNTPDELDDLISIGTVGLIKAVSSFNAHKGSKLATYASRCIENEILMHLRTSKKYAGDISLQDPMGVDTEGNEISLEDKLSDDLNVEDSVSQKMELEKLAGKMGSLGPRELEVVGSRYGLYGGDEQTQREIAKRLGISRSYVSRIEKKALKKLYDEMCGC